MITELSILSSTGNVMGVVKPILLDVRELTCYWLMVIAKQGWGERVGGFAYLAELSKNTPSVANILAYASVGNMLVADVQALNARSEMKLTVLGMDVPR